MKKKGKSFTANGEEFKKDKNMHCCVYLIMEKWATVFAMSEIMTFSSYLDMIKLICQKIPVVYLYMYKWDAYNYIT